MIRIFAAFPLKSLMENHAKQLFENNKNLRNIRWTPAENLHITLFFIGEIEEENLESTEKNFTGALTGQSSFEIIFESIQMKGKKNRASMIWAQYRRSEEFRNISEKIHQAAKPFMTIDVVHSDPLPHCTLARIKQGCDVEAIDLSAVKEFPEKILIDRAEIWKTVQGKEGVNYERLSDVRLMSISG